MKIQVKLYAICKEIAKTNQIELDLDENGSTKDLLNKLIEKFPEMEKISPNIAFAINKNYVPSETILKERDIVSLIPPVSGGWSCKK